MTSTDLSVPAGAYDVDIDTIPSNDDTRWGPYDPVAGRRRWRQRSRLRVPGPGQADAGLDAIRPVDLSRYADAAPATPITTSAWCGARGCCRPDGIFAADNPNTYNGMGVNRFVIFMTDGDPTAAQGAYTAWGVEQYDQRTGSVGSDTSRHVQRMNIVCNSLKAKNVSIWVVGFDNDIDYVKDCARNSNQAAVASDQAALIAKFTEIGQTIGSLRLSQ